MSKAAKLLPFIAFIACLFMGASSASAQSKGVVQAKKCGDKDCAPSGETVTDGKQAGLALPPPNKELTRLKTIPGFEITYRSESGGRDLGVYEVTIDQSRKAKVDKSELDDFKSGTVKISKKKLLKLLHQFGEIGFMDITSESLRQNCKPGAKHGSTQTISLSIGGKSNTVTYYTGCNSNAKSVTQKALKKLSWTIQDLTKKAKLSKSESDSNVQRLD